MTLNEIGELSPALAARRPIEDCLAAAGLPQLPRTAWLEVDLDALRGNLGVLRELVGPDVRLEPVVKADAYGHGAGPVARTLEAAGADGLAVATIDEAVELRDAGVTLPILVLYPVPPGQVATPVALGVAVALGGGASAQRVLAAADRALADHPGQVLDIHLELETGLGRGGILPGDAAASVAAIGQRAGVRLGGIWTHVAAADDLAATRLQDARFGAALDGLADAARLGGRDAWRHLAASGVVLAADVRRWDAVRVGLAVYGLVPDALVPPPETSEAAARLRPAMSLVTRPIRVARLPSGHGVSYGPSFVTARPTQIATLPVGYGDGWRRALSDRAQALVRGHRVPLVGRVSMDAVMADVTDVPGPPVTEDDEVVLLGAQGSQRITAFELAATCETISYEILTGLSRRLPRVYHAAGSPVEIRLLAGGRSEWRESSSGTAISATSRSTRS